MALATSRVVRTREIRKKIDKEWTIYWWSIANLKIGIHGAFSLTYLSANPNIRMHIVLENNLNWDWRSLSSNPGITLEDIVNNPDKPWDWMYVYDNPNITLDFVLANPDKNWHWHLLSANPGITLIDIINNPDKPWDWIGVLKNPNITLDYLIKNMYKIPLPLHEIFKRASCNPGIKLADIMSHKKLKWDWRYGISRNPNLTIDIALKNKHMNLCWINIIMNPVIIPTDLHKLLPEKYKQNCSFSANPNLTLEFVQANPHIAWDWSRISNNPNITINNIIEYPNLPWTMYIMQKNKFTRSKLDFEIQHYRRHLAAFRIQQHWHRIRLDPRHSVCQRRLEKEYDELVELFKGEGASAGHQAL